MASRFHQARTAAGLVAWLFVFVCPGQFAAGVPARRTHLFS